MKFLAYAVVLLYPTFMIQQASGSNVCSAYSIHNKVWWRKVVFIKPALKDIQECLRYCSDENAWVPITTFWGRYNMIQECLKEELGYTYEKRQIVFQLMS